MSPGVTDKAVPGEKRSHQTYSEISLNSSQPQNTWIPMEGRARAPSSLLLKAFLPNQQHELGRWVLLSFPTLLLSSNIPPAQTAWSLRPGMWGIILCADPQQHSPSGQGLAPLKLCQHSSAHIKQLPVSSSTCTTQGRGYPGEPGVPKRVRRAQVS